MTELLSDPAYRHVLLNHIPVIGLIIAFVVLIIGVVFRQTAVLLTGLALVAVSAGLSLPVGIFGNEAYPAVFDRLGRLEHEQALVRLCQINTAPFET